MHAKDLHGIKRKTAAICRSVLHRLLGEAQRLEIWPQHGSAPEKKTDLPDAMACCIFRKLVWLYSDGFHCLMN